MSTLHDAALLSVVYALTGVYAAAVYAWFVVLDVKPVEARPRLYLAVSIVLGVLLLAITNYYLSALIGSKGTAVIVPILPIGAFAFAGTRDRRILPRIRALGATLGKAAGPAGICAIFVLAALHKLFTADSLSGMGILHPDLPFHIGLAVEQAFQSSPGFRPLSPIAFPDPMPYLSFVSDSLAAVTLRYLPFPLHAFNYSQAIFAWAMVLWTSAVLMNEEGGAAAVIVLATSLFLVPTLIWGYRSVGSMLLVSFHSNPNSAIDWPIGLAFVFHLYRSWQRRTSPVWAFVVVIPPASLFFKANAAFAYGFLSVLGILIGFTTLTRRNWIRYSLCASIAWMLAFAAALGTGRWPISAGIRLSAENFWQYAGAAIPSLKERSWSLVLMTALAYLGIIAVAGIAKTRLKRFTTESAHRRSAWHDVAIPLLVLGAAMLYLLAGWSLIVPLGIGEGEPMHVNFELILWLLTVPVAASLCVVYDAAPASRVLRAGFAVAVLVSTLAMMAVLNSRPPGDGGLPLERDYSVSAEARFRDAVKAIIPDGNCFAYGRRYVLYTIVDGEFPPDFTIAATGCPQLNGTRWRGNLGDNRPESLAMSPAIAVPAGEPFRVVAFTPCAAPETPAHVAATVSGKTVQLSWSAVSGAEMYQIEVGSKPGWTDQGTLRSSAPGLEFPNVAAGLYFTRVRAGNRCGKGGASDEIQVRVN